MAMKVTVVDGKGGVLGKKRVATEKSFQKLLDKFNVTTLVDDEGFEVEEFESLVDGEYTLGKTNGRTCFRFSCQLLNFKFILLCISADN